jgi:protein SCO1/2
MAADRRVRQPPGAADARAGAARRRAARALRQLAAALAAVLLLTAPAAAGRAGERYPVTGMVVSVDPAALTFVASIERIPGFMEAMAMPFRVRDAASLAALAPGAVVEFMLVVEKDASHAEGIRVRRFQTVEQDPLTARRLSVLTRVARGRAAAPVAQGQPVPDFTLTDQTSRRVSLSELRGSVVAINFMYTTCQLPDFCLRMVNHFSALRRRFAPRLGRDLVFLTITFDPVRDQPDVLARYARQWNADPRSWHFLTGAVPSVRRVLDMFGVAAYPDEGLMDHSLHTVLVGRDGRLAANVEGNQFSSDQLADLTAGVLDAGRATPPGR